MRCIGTIFVSRTDPTASVEDTAETLQAARRGDLLAAFPEGTLTRMPGLLDFRLGAFLVAAQSSIPVIPVTIVGTRSTLRGGQWFPRYGSISVHIDKGMPAEGDDFDAAIGLRDAVRVKILERCHEPDLAGEKIEL